MFLIGWYRFYQIVRSLLGLLGKLFCPRPINCGTFQGSGVGPTDYIIRASDLRALSVSINKLFKYADDTTLLVPQFTDVTLADEFGHLVAWAESNKMIINRSKTKELVFHRSDPRLFIPPELLVDIERVNSVKLLGVYFSDSFRFHEHVKYILTLCKHRCYLLKTLRGQGLSPQHINTVFQSLIISRLAYALPAWGGFLAKENINKINSFLFKVHRFGYSLGHADVNDIIQDTDIVLFKSVVNNNTHCIHNLLLAVKQSNNVST
jgi:hypothetical protein